VVLKLSGEVLGGTSGRGLDVDYVRKILGQISEIRNLGTEIGIVVGGGNFLRGKEAISRGLGRISADYIGMLGTVMNGVALRDIGGSLDLDVRVMSCLPSGSFVEPYDVERAVGYLERGRVCVLVGGTGNPLLTTDTAAALRAAEMEADVLLKATKVDGVYSTDPAEDRSARRYTRISFKDAIDRELGFMDRSALVICGQSEIPVVVFNINEDRSIVRVVAGEDIGTVVEGGSHD
jgi:uridylate kinase